MLPRFTRLTNPLNCEVLIIGTNIDWSVASSQVFAPNNLMIWTLCAASLAIHSVSILMVASAFDAFGRVIGAPQEVIVADVVIAVASRVFAQVVNATTAAAAIFH